MPDAEKDAASEEARRRFLTEPVVHRPCDMGCQPDWHHDDCAIYQQVGGSNA